jgi:hypothetical protein
MSHGSGVSGDRHDNRIAPMIVHVKFTGETVTFDHSWVYIMVSRYVRSIIGGPPSPGVRI